MFKIEVEIPAGETCIGNTGKPCVMARYTKKWNAYNCAVHNKILKGGNCPRKCRECISYCNEAIREEKRRKHIRVNPEKTCDNCGNCQYIGEGDHICIADASDVVIVMEEHIPNENYCHCCGKYWEAN